MEKEDIWVKHVCVRERERERERESHVLLFPTPWTVAHQASLSMGFSRQAYWRGLPFPSPGDLPNSGTEPASPALQADFLPQSRRGVSTCMKHHAVCERPLAFPLICIEYDCCCSVAQLCLTLCHPTGCSRPGSSVRWILQARILEWVAPFPSPGDLPNSGIEPASPALAAGFFTTELSRKPHRICCKCAYSILQIRGMNNLAKFR